MAKKSVNEHWEDIFKEHNVLAEINSKGAFFISASVIKKYKEPRLMTKFDHSISRPKIFRDNNLAILPVDNGKYVIGKFSLYKSLPKDDDVKPKIMKLPNFLESIDPDNIYSENNALNVAMISGMISDVIGEDVHETISGRMRASKFNFSVNRDQNGISEIEVLKPQIEIDGGYESQSKILVVEAKNSTPNDFIIRQLYYPYRFWKMKVDKEIVPVFFTYKNGEYTFYVYKFKDDNNYSSIELVDKLSYVIDYENKKVINSYDLEIKPENSKIPFPQADTFNRVKELIDLVPDNIDSAKKVAEHYEIVQRQGNYYLSAAKYLGLVGGRGTYTLTNLGNSLLDMDLHAKNYELSKLILCHKPFLNVYKYYLEHDRLPEKKLVIGLMESAGVNIKSDNSVLNRRASTVLGWIKWIINSGIELRK